MAMPIVFVLILSSLISLIRTEDSFCIFQTVQIPIKDVLLSNGAYFRGAALSIGSPPQAVSFQPVLQLNNTWVYDENEEHCVWGDTIPQCITYSGGTFSSQSSNSFHEVGGYSDAGADPDNATYTGVIWATEELQVALNLSLPQFPIAIAQDGNLESFQSPLGLGINSTLLSRLRRLGTVGSRTWSMWWGLVGTEPHDQMDGSLVLGGYDAAKIYGVKNHTGVITPPGDDCASGMSVNITDLNMSFPNGSSFNLLFVNGERSSFIACISLEYTHAMGLPHDPYYARFEAWSNSTKIGNSGGINYNAPQYDPSQVYQGDILVGLDSGFQIGLSNSQLVQLDASANAETGSMERNTSASTVQIWDITETALNPFLGSNFFTGAMIMVDRDEGTFTLWQAKPTTETNFVPVSNTKEEEDCLPTLPLQGPDDFGSDTDTGTGTDRHEGPTFTAGVIAGIVVGGVVGLVLAGVCIFWCVKRYGRVTEVTEIPQKVPIAKLDHIYAHSSKGDPKFEQVESQAIREAPSGHAQEVPGDYPRAELNAPPTLLREPTAEIYEMP